MAMERHNGKTDDDRRTNNEGPIDSLKIHSLVFKGSSIVPLMVGSSLVQILTMKDDEYFCDDSVVSAVSVVSTVSAVTKVIHLSPLYNMKIDGFIMMYGSKYG